MLSLRWRVASQQWPMHNFTPCERGAMGLGFWNFPKKTLHYNNISCIAMELNSLENLSFVCECQDQRFQHTWTENMTRMLTPFNCEHVSLLLFQFRWQSFLFCPCCTLLLFLLASFHLHYSENPFVLLVSWCQKLSFLLSEWFPSTRECRASPNLSMVRTC